MRVSTRRANDFMTAEIDPSMDAWLYLNRRAARDEHLESADFSTSKGISKSFVGGTIGESDTAQETAIYGERTR